MKYEFTILCDVNPDGLDEMINRLMAESAPYAGAVSYREITDIKAYENGN